MAFSAESWAGREGEVVQEDEAGLVRGRKSPFLRVFAVGDREDAEACLDRLSYSSRMSWRSMSMRAARPRRSGSGPGLEDRLDRALADEDVVALVLDDHRHAFPDEVEGDFVDLARFADVEVLVGEDREVEEVAQARLIVAVHPGVAQDVLGRPVRRVDVTLEGQLSWVIVPALSVQRMSRSEVLYRLELLTMTFLRDMNTAPLERQTVTMPWEASPG